MADKKDKPKEKSFLETVREIDERERLEEEAEEERKAEARKQRELERKKAYEEQLKREKIELMKLKAGVITDDDIPKEETVEKHYTIWQKIGNFIYHDKAYIIFGIAFAALAIFLIYNLVTTVRPDMTILYIDGDFYMQYQVEEMGKLFEPYCEDYNGDGKTVVDMYYVPADYDDDNNASMQLAQSDRAKLVAEFQSGEAIMIIGTLEDYEAMGITENVLQDMREIYPDDPNAEELGYKITGTDLKERLGYEGLRDNLYISFRLPKKLVGTNYDKMNVNYERALKVFDDYLKSINTTDNASESD